MAIELLNVDEVWGTKKDKEEKKRKKEEHSSSDLRATRDLRKLDKKKDDVEVEGQGLLLLEEEEVTDEQKPKYAGHVVAVVERAPGQFFSGLLGVLRPSSAATQQKQDHERRERDGGDSRGGGNNFHQAPKIIWFRPTDKRVPLMAIRTLSRAQSGADSPSHRAGAARLYREPGQVLEHAVRVVHQALADLVAAPLWHPRRDAGADRGHRDRDGRAAQGLQLFERRCVSRSLPPLLTPGQSSARLSSSACLSCRTRSPSASTAPRSDATTASTRSSRSTPRPRATSTTRSTSLRTRTARSRLESTSRT